MHDTKFLSSLVLNPEALPVPGALSPGKMQILQLCDEREWVKSASEQVVAFCVRLDLVVRSRQSTPGLTVRVKLNYLGRDLLVWREAVGTHVKLFLFTFYSALKEAVLFGGSLK